MTSAAQAGHPLAQLRLAIMYEGADAVPRDKKAAFTWYGRATAVGEPALLGRAYEFGVDVPQDRQQAVAWFAKAGAQGLGQGEYFARWLRDPLNNIGFRTQAEHDPVIGGKLRFGLLSGDATGITFHSSAQRTAWLTAQRREVDLTEAHTMWRIRADEYSQCQRAGGSSGINRGSDPARR